MKRIIFIFFIGFLFADYGGGYAGSGFRYGSNAREFSLAGAVVADKTPGFYAFSNPALLHLSRDNHIGISFQNMSLDRYIESYTFARRLPPNAGLGIAILQSGTKNILGRDGQNKETEYFSTQETEYIISFGVAISSKLALGINIKALFTSIYGDYNGNGISGDIGFTYKFNRRLHVGALMKNLNASYNWERSYEEQFPQMYALGIAYSGLQETSLFFQEDIVSIPGKYINYRSRLGVEYRLPNNVKLRGGLMQARGALAYNEEKNSINLKPSFGAGIPVKVWKKQYLQMDYALDLGSVGEGLSHLYSFSMKLK